MTAIDARTGVWRNWGRSESIRPKRIERPATPEAVQRAVVAAAKQGMLSLIHI